MEHLIVHCLHTHVEMNLESYVLVLQGTLQQFVDDFFRCVLCSGNVVPPAVKYFFDFLDEQAEKHDNVDEETIHIWKTNRYETLNASEKNICLKGQVTKTKNSNL